MMSEVVKHIRLIPPTMNNKQETIISSGHTCGYCHGNGWFWGLNEAHEDVKVDCPHCLGTGKLDAVIQIDWVAAE